jgi:hypothetical protein
LLGCGATVVVTDGAEGGVDGVAAWAHLGLRPPGPVDVLPLDLGVEGAG